MDGDEAARFMMRAKELRDLAKIIRNEEHRRLLLESAEAFENLAKQVRHTGPER